MLSVDWIAAILFVVYSLYTRSKEAKLVNQIDDLETKLEKAKQALRANDLPTSHLEI